LIPLVNKIFNRLYNNGDIPESWSKAIIVTLHKKGNNMKKAKPQSELDVLFT
jgi:hypothetical protein